MNYFRAKSDLAFMTQFHNDVLALWEREGAASRAIQSPDSWMAGCIPGQWQALMQKKASEQSPDYQKIRKSVAQGVSRAQFLSTIHGVPAQFVSYPAPAVGGPVIRLGVFEAILTDTSHGGIDRQMIYDALNRVIGACEEKKERAWHEMINPFFILKNIILMTLRLPFMLIEATGFNISKFEEHFFGKLFKLLLLLGLAWGLLALGFEKADLVEVLKSYG
jgi:hypothetical protein